MTTSLPLMKNVLTPLTKSVLVLLGLTAAASVTDAAIQKKIYGSKTTLVFSNEEEIYDFLKVVKSLEDAGLLMKGVRETVENELKEEKFGLLDMLAAALGASLLENMLAGNVVIQAGEGVMKSGEGQDF